MNPFAAVYRYVSGHPIGFWFIFWGELAERCSFYGMRALLTVYMVEQLHFEDENATRVYHLFVMSCYFLPLVGGWIADNYLGKYWTIVGFSLPYILGHVIIGWESELWLFVALALLAMGTGVIKPNISTLMGLTYDQRRPGLEQLRSDAFSIFYAAINIGSAISTTWLPSVRMEHGFSKAFLIPAVLMFFAFVFFAAGKRFYAVEVIERRTKTPAERKLQFDVIYRLSGILLVVTIFWMIFDQHGSTWTYFARDHLVLNVFGKQIPPEQLQALNPWFIIALLPVMAIAWRLLPKFGIHLKPTSKMAIGMALTGVCMGVMALASYFAGEGRVSIAWQIVAYLMITVAEICVSVIGLELSFSVAPKSMKSFVSACWLLPVAFANILNFVLAPFYGMLGPTTFFGLLALALVPVTLAFLVVASWFNRGAEAWQAVDTGAVAAPPRSDMEIDGEALEAAG